MMSGAAFGPGAGRAGVAAAGGVAGGAGLGASASGAGARRGAALLPPLPSSTNSPPAATAVSASAPITSRGGVIVTINLAFTCQADKCLAWLHLYTMVLTPGLARGRHPVPKHTEWL